MGYTDGYLLAHANVPGSGVYDHGTPKFVKVTVSKDGSMTVKDELSLAAVDTHQFFGDGGDGAYFVEDKFVIFTGAEKAPCPEIPGRHCPHMITRLACISFPLHGKMQLGQVIDLSANFTAITNIARTSSGALIVAGYGGIPMEAGIIEVPVHASCVGPEVAVDKATVFVT